MKKCICFPGIYFVAVLLFASCNGKVKKGFPVTSVNEPKLLKTGTPKIPKSQRAEPGNIHCGLQDKAGNLWFGTTSDGVYRYDGKTFVNFTEKDGLNNNFVSAILEDKAGNIWFGTNSGLCRYDGKTFSTIPLSNTFNQSNSPNIPGKISLAKNAVWSIMQDKSGKLWFGTFEDGVYCYDGKVFTHFLHNDQVENSQNLKLHTVNSIVEDESGNIWFTTWFEGLCRFDGKAITSFKPNNEVWYSALLKDKQGTIWIGRRGKGVSRFDGKTFTNVAQGGVFDSCGVFPLAQDSKGNIWFGTMHSNIAKRKNSSGLWRYDGETFKKFTAIDSLKNNTVWSAIEDRNGYLWLGATNNELFRYDGKTFLSFSE